MPFFFFGAGFPAREVNEPNTQTQAISKLCSHTVLKNLDEWRISKQCSKHFLQQEGFITSHISLASPFPHSGGAGGMFVRRREVHSSSKCFSVAGTYIEKRSMSFTVWHILSLMSMCKRVCDSSPSQFLPSPASVKPGRQLQWTRPRSERHSWAQPPFLSSQGSFTDAHKHKRERDTRMKSGQPSRWFSDLAG